MAQNLNACHFIWFKIRVLISKYDADFAPGGKFQVQLTKINDYTKLILLCLKFGIVVFEVTLGKFNYVQYIKSINLKV